MQEAFNTFSHASTFGHYINWPQVYVERDLCIMQPQESFAEL